MKKLFRQKQSGYTVMELVAAIAGLAVVVLGISLVYTLFHFIAKFW